MLWFTLWFMVILKIPILYLLYVIWWAVKDPPATEAGPAADAAPEDGLPPGPWRHRRRFRPRRRGPHGSPERRPAHARRARSRSTA
ncbi:MAG: hypothetical protein M3123_04740 [Actinomycetota bacterium]|nr:hypothetical protein [Actinomycetota bacterium]